MYVNHGLTYYDVLLKPRKSVVNSRTEISLKTKFSRNVELQIPIVSANMDTITESKMAIAMAELGGLGIIHRFCSIEKQVEEVRAVKERNLLVGAAIGVSAEDIKRIEALLTVKPDVFVLDVAHAHSERVITMVAELYERFPDIELVIGNIATDDAAAEFTQRFPQLAGVKVGIGGGSVCTTREKTGCGVPQVSAIQLCRTTVPLCADGGIRNSGDIVKALAFGADTVMIGGLFAGYPETPSIGDMKVYRGMASKSTIIDNKKHGKYVFAEGITQVLKVKDASVKEFVEAELIPGILSGLSYLGVRSIAELHKASIEYHVVSASGQKESATHSWQ
jgi:IMP dehydrogenase